MRRPRLLAPDRLSHALYHCISRMVRGEPLLGDVEKEKFVEYMRLYANFCGLSIHTYAVMGNHFHILVEVPRRPEALPGDEKLVALVRETYGEERADDLQKRLAIWREGDDRQAAEEERERWFRQMWNLSHFMKVLKQRFAQWYNGRQEERRKGTLWQERFRSVLVQDGTALQTMAMYIDLNPVRAGIVNDSKDYRWCGYGEAAAGQSVAQEGLARMAGLSSPALANRTQDPADWVADMVCWYRQELFGKGEEKRDAEGNVVRRGFTPEEIQAVRDAQGRLPLHVYVRQRVRYFTDGVVLGNRAFVEEIFQAKRRWFSPRRRDGARRLTGLVPECPLRTMRALAVNPFG